VNVYSLQSLHTVEGLGQDVELLLGVDLGKVLGLWLMLPYLFLCYLCISDLVFIKCLFIYYSKLPLFYR
jgi:hypothetical protein